MTTITVRPGVKFVRNEKRKGIVRNVLIYDMDKTLTWERMIQNLERLTDAEFAARWGLPKEVFELVRAGDVRTRKVWFDILFTPLMFPTLLGSNFEIETLGAMQQDWLNTVARREKRAEAFDKAVGALLQIKYKWGAQWGGEFGLEQWVLTDCPTPLAACFRLRSAGFLPVLDGVIGMAPNCPDELRKCPYAGIAGLVEGFILGEYENLPDNIRLLGELQQGSAKPSADGVFAALDTCELHPDVRIVIVDDKWSKGGLVAEEVRKVYPNTYFVHADCEGAEPLPVTGKAPAIFGTITNFDQLPALADKAFAEVAPAIAA